LTNRLEKLLQDGYAFLVSLSLPPPPPPNITVCWHKHAASATVLRAVVAGGWGGDKKAWAFPIYSLYDTTEIFYECPRGITVG
jgi:hypothetical protein